MNSSFSFFDNLFNDYPKETPVEKLLSQVATASYKLGRDLILLETNPFIILEVGAGGLLGSLAIYPGIEKILKGSLYVEPKELCIVEELNDGYSLKDLFEGIENFTILEGVSEDIETLYIVANLLSNKPNKEGSIVYISYKNISYCVTFNSDFYIWTPEDYEEFRATQYQALFLVLSSLLLNKSTDTFRQILNDKYKAEIMILPPK